ncbi:MAG: hypothetical protein QM675_08650 [Protaetiibacter sp.]
MAEPTDPQSTVTPEPVVEPELVEPVPEAAEPEAVAEAVSAEVPAAVEAVEIPAAPEPLPVPAVPATPREVVYVQAPTPPTPRHNRGFGALMSIVGAIVFASLYLGAAAIVFAFTPGTAVESTFSAFLGSDAFWIPVAAYTVFSVLFALIVNRAAWWAHVIGSLFVALLSYAVSVAVLALLRNVVATTPDEAARLFATLASSALLLSVAALARETSLWFGLAIAFRGRRVKERNTADRVAFEQSVAERRAEYERAHPSA